jgi:hypothetical protein
MVWNRMEMHTGRGTNNVVGRLHDLNHERWAKSIRVHNDVVDRNMDKLHEVSDEAHERKPNCGRNDDLLVLCKKLVFAAHNGERPFRSGFVQRLSKRLLSCANFTPGCIASLSWSMASGCLRRNL